MSGRLIPRWIERCKTACSQDRYLDKQYIRTINNSRGRAVYDCYWKWRSPNTCDTLAHKRGLTPFLLRTKQAFHAPREEQVSLVANGLNEFWGVKENFSTDGKFILLRCLDLAFLFFFLHHFEERKIWKFIIVFTSIKAWKLFSFLW